MAAGERLFGTQVKIPTPHATEILGGLGFDFILIDGEHAPFERTTIDLALLAARATGTPALVRVSDGTAANLSMALDCGATGVVVPHVDSAEKAREVARACRFKGGRRGYSNSPRAGRYGGYSMWEHVEAADATTVIIAQIEDPEALQEIEDIAAVDGIDALFIGRADLAIAMGAAATDAPKMLSALDWIFAAAKAAGKPVSVFVASLKDGRDMIARGATMFIYSSDQGFIRQGALQAIADFKALD